MFVPLAIMAIGMLVGILKFQRLGQAQRSVIILMGLALLVEVLSLTLSKKSFNTVFIFHVYAPIEYCLLAWVFVKTSFDRRGQKALYLSMALIFLLAIANLLFWQSYNELNTNVIIVSSITLVVISVLSFFRILNKMVYTKIEKSSFFWINIGVLTYFSSSIVLFVFGDWLTQLDLEYSINVWLIHIFFNIIQYLCFNIALWMDPE
ncbi:hypothetical protein [Roseivirga pacifica]|uniref:hypothetical protein n=1 Tax=Roseivirga pacifica TaxID=1267423 RepID=UPI003BB0199C